MRGGEQDSPNGPMLPARGDCFQAMRNRDFRASWDTTTCASLRPAISKPRWRCNTASKGSVIGTIGLRDGAYCNAHLPRSLLPVDPTFRSALGGQTRVGQASG